MISVFRCLMVAFALTMGMAASTSAAPIFSDNFQGTLAQWNAGSNGQIVANPLGGGGNALNFTATKGGGDLFSAASYSSPTDMFRLTFDYLGTCGGSECGAFIGFNNPFETWLAGGASYPTPHLLTDTGAWQTISFEFTSTLPIQLKLEDFSGAPLDAYFRNLVLEAVSVPEPASMALLGIGIAGLAWRRKAKAA